MSKARSNLDDSNHSTISTSQGWDAMQPIQDLELRLNCQAKSLFFIISHVAQQSKYTKTSDNNLKMKRVAAVYQFHTFQQWMQHHKCMAVLCVSTCIHEVDCYIDCCKIIDNCPKEYFMMSSCYRCPFSYLALHLVF